MSTAGIIDTVLRDVIQRDLKVTFEDIAALDGAKRLLNEAIVLPMIMPEFFTGRCTEFSSDNNC
jgi:katanin p60 ATPase-containing subunit A1